MTPEPLPTAARLYYTGIGSRRYKRASVHNGPGEPLCFKSVAEQAIRREVASAVSAERARHAWLGARIRAIANALPNVADGEGPQVELLQIARELTKDAL